MKAVFAALTGAIALLLATLAWLALDHGGAAPPPAMAHLAAATTAVNPDQLDYPPGAPQLAMIRSQMLPALALPLSDALSARVALDEDRTVRISAAVAGRIVAIKAAPGDKVRAGQLLAEIDSADFGSAVADLDKARADEQRKRLVVERARALVPGEAIAGKDWDAALADYAQARAETARATQHLATINPHGLRAAQGPYIRLASPIDGVVVERTATPALEVGPGLTAPLFVLTDRQHAWLLIDVPEALQASVRVGGAVDVESDAFPGEHFRATVSQLGQAVDPNTRRLLVRARLDNRAGKLLPEMFVRAALLREQGSAVRVPNTALVNRGLYSYVFVEPAPGQFRRKQVELLTRGSAQSYIASGIAAGEHIVTAGALLLDAEMSARTGGAP